MSLSFLRHSTCVLLNLSESFKVTEKAPFVRSLMASYSSTTVKYCLFCTTFEIYDTSFSRMCVMNHNWSATKQRLQSVAEISRHSVFVKGQDSTMWDIVWFLPQGHRSVSVSRHFLLQAPQCPCSVRKWFSRDHCCQGRSKPSCQIVGSHTR